MAVATRAIASKNSTRKDCSPTCMPAVARIRSAVCRRSIECLLADQRDAIEHGGREADRLPQHPGARDGERQKDGKHLGNESKSLFLDLRGGLEEAHHESDDHPRC